MREINEGTVLENGEFFYDIIDERLKNNSKPASFKDVLGDLSDCVFFGNLNLEQLNLSSLEGCPKEVRKGWLSIEGNPQLKTMHNLPTFYYNNDNVPKGTLYIDSSFDISCDYSLKLILKTFNTVSLITNTSNINISTPEFKANRIVANYLNKVFWIKKISGTFDTLIIPTLSDKDLLIMDRLEKLYQLYEKVDFDLEKFDRILELL